MHKFVIIDYTTCACTLYYIAFFSHFPRQVLKPMLKLMKLMWMEEGKVLVLRSSTLVDRLYDYHISIGDCDTFSADCDTSRL
jgi:hypothetical protein